MVPIQNFETDEVWLALQQAESAMRRDGHVPSLAKTSCMMCHALHLVQRAKVVYLERQITREPH
jgi:hypothetical protein